MSRFKNTLYKSQKIVFQNHRRMRIENDNSTALKALSQQALRAVSKF